MTKFFTLDRTKHLGNALEDAAGGWLIIAIAAAPWMYGSTRHWAIIRLCVLLTLMSGYWLVGLALQWRSPRLPKKVVTPVIFLLISGWITVLVGTKVMPDPFTTSHAAMLYERMPGSFIVKTPVENMWLFSGLIAALCVTIDLSADRAWRNAFCAAMAIVGASIVILGIVQIRTQARSILWNEDMQVNGYFFATFFHRSFATAFINLVWPLGASLLLFRLFQATNNYLSRGVEILLWGAVVLINFSGLAAQDSKFGLLNGVILMLLLFAWVLWRRPVKQGRFAVWSIICVISLVGLLDITAVGTGKYAKISERWQAFFSSHQTSLAYAPDGNGFAMHPNMFLESSDPKAQQFLGDHRLALATCLRMIPQSGLLGFGPGTWTLTYAHFTNDLLLRTFFLYIQFAHNDYLQTIVEWGILGAAAWGFLIFGSLKAGLQRLICNRTKQNRFTREEAISFGCALSLMGVLFDSFIAFPLQIPSIQLYVCVLVGLLWASRLRAAVPTPIVVQA